MPQLTIDDIVHGIVVPLVTPLLDSQRLDRAALERLIEHVVSGGVSGIFALGTSGEGPSLSHRLRAEVVEAVCGQAAGRVPVLVGVTDTAYDESLQLARIAERSHAAAVVLAPPFYFQISQNDLLRYVERFAADSPLPVFLYNIPSLTKTAFEVETVRKAARIAGVVGLKDSSGDLGYFRAVIGSAGSSFPVMMGPEEMLLDGMRAGAAGGVCGGANLNPRLFTELYRAIAASDFDEAERLQARVREISDALYTVGDRGGSYLRGLKCAMAISGLCSDVLALPFAPFTREERLLLEARLESLGCVV